MNQSKLSRSVLITVAYSHQFEYPLSVYEIWLRLIGRDRVSISKVSQCVEQLVEAGILFQSEKLVSLSPHVSAQFRAQKKHISQQKWDDALWFSQLVSNIPWVSGVVITGSLALNNVNPDDDTDFLIITTKNRMWLSRLVISGLAFIMGKRRTWSREEPNSWCFNLWLEDSHLHVDKHDVYRAFEVCQAEWLFQKDGVRDRFLRRNTWVKHYLPNFYQKKRTEPILTYDRVFGWKIPVVSEFFDVLNWMAFAFQRLYMQSHMTTELVGYRYAFFHPRDTKRMIFENWKNALQHCLQNR